MLRAARALASEAGVTPRGKLILEKCLPVSSGIGGGSADAAAALRLLRRFWGVSVEEARLFDIARGLGADVPVCLLSRPAMMAGIGERLTAVSNLPNAGILLINPGVAVSTPAVFRSLGAAFSQPADFPAKGWPTPESLVASLRMTANDLEPPARRLVPAISNTLAVLVALPGCMTARMSGSGATCFGLFSTPDDARDAARMVGNTGWWVWGGGLTHQ